MFRAILIDDEPWALESLYRVFRWEESGFEVVGRYTDAIEGWEAIEREQPDVAFIDICMPGMKGLEIAERARTCARATLFIVVSGYGSFEYAQQALRLGIFDYCLKPVDRMDAGALMVKLRAELEQREKHRHAEILEAVQEGQDALELFRRHGVAPEGEWWQVVVARFVGAEEKRALDEAMDGRRVLPVCMGPTKWMYIVNSAARGSGKMERDMAELCAKFPMEIGMSRCDCHSNRLLQRVSEARGCAYNDFIDGRRGLTVYHGHESVGVSERVQEVCDAIAAASPSRWEKTLDRCMEMLRAEGVQLHQLCRYWNRWMDVFARSGRECVQRRLEWIAEPEDMRSFGSLEELCAFLDDLMGLYMETGEPVKSAGSQMLRDMADYVRAHFKDRMRLSDLAEQFHLNTAYCSEIFRKSVGMTYTDYVTKLRMEYAWRQLTQDGDCSLQALALELGYGDYFTFSKRFKKYYGMSPSHVGKTE